MGRWFSVDPVFQPWQSPYTSMDNNPVNLIDPLGLRPDNNGDGPKNGDMKSVLSEDGNTQYVLECVAETETWKIAQVEAFPFTPPQ